MFGILIVAAAGLVAWKYRDSLTEYVKGNTAPAREKADELLRAVQQQISSGLDSARDKLKGGASKEKREGSGE